MNMIDAYVTRVIKGPYQRPEPWAKGKWFLDVTYTAWSDKEEPYTFMEDSKEVLEQINKGYKFMV